MKAFMTKEEILKYIMFDQYFDIHIDASDRQLGTVISQDGKSLAFYSRKLSCAQRNYTTTEQEQLSIVETLNEFRNILLGHKSHHNELYTAHLLQRPHAYT